MATTIPIEEVFAAIDKKDADRFASFLTADAVFRYGSQDPVRGREPIRDFVAGFFGTVRDLRHRLSDRWERPDAVMVEGEVTYTLHDDREVSVPFVDVFRLKDDKVHEYLVYIDPTPLAG